MKKILVIDDDNMFGDMLRNLLNDAGYHVFVAQNGVEALRHQKQNPVDLILTDIVMPEKEGIATIIEFRKKYPATKIIAMSGGGRINSVDYLEIAAKLGAQRTFAKPFRTGNILAAVNELLKEQ